MALKQVYNPLSGEFDLVQAQAGGYPEVATFADLPAPATVTGDIYVVLNATGAWYLLNRRDAGFYYSNGSAWRLLDGLPDYVLDSNFRVQNNLDSTKQLALDVSQVTTGNTRTLTVPNTNGTIATEEYVTDNTYISEV